MFKQNVLLVFILILVLIAGVLVGCDKRTETIDLSSKVENNTTDDEKDKKIPLQTEEQKAITTPEAHFNYIVDHQSKLNLAVQELKDMIVVPEETNNSTSLMTTEIKYKIKELYAISQEYNTYYNKIESTKEADKYYKLAMKSFDDFVKQCEQDLTSGSYDKEDSGIESLMDMMELTIKAYEVFDNLNKK